MTGSDILTAAITYGLASIFLLNAITNIRPPSSIARKYNYMGYPSWWHFVVAVISLTGAVLLVVEETTILGAIVIGLLMVAAIVSVIRVGKTSDSVPPLVLLALSLTLLWLGSSA